MGSSSGSDRKAPSLDDDILSYLRGWPAAHTRNEIRRHLKSHYADGTNGSPSKRDVKRALKRLVKRGIVEKSKKSYRLVVYREAGFDDANTNGEENGSNDDEERAEDAAFAPVDLPVDLPIAKRMRQNQEMTNNGKLSFQSDERNGGTEGVDLDEEIRRLEAELAADSESDRDDVSGEDESDHEEMPFNNKKTISFGENSVHEFDAVREDSKQKSPLVSHDVNGGPGIICLSELANDKIEPLPRSALPQNKRRTLKIDSSRTKEEGSHKSKKRKSDKSEKQQQQHAVSEGLQSAVRDLLSSYVRPSHLDRPPFYCRICQVQSSSQSEFDAHRQTEFHSAAVQEEKRRTYCKLCRKQLTSVVQMEEHLKSRPHRERMDYVKGKQRGSIGGRGGRGGGRTGKGWQNQRGGRSANSDSSRRQWC